MASNAGGRAVDQPSLLDETEAGPGSSVQPSPTGKKRAHADPHVTRAAVDSALWAAWADALGFISELTTPRGLYRRLRLESPDFHGSPADQVDLLLRSPREQWPLQSTVQWSRRVGGRGGPSMTLPAGTYSDDTQLRLATGRCIDGGVYSPEHFAYIELPTFTSYGLGGGRATKGGAGAMTRPNVGWAAPSHEGWVSAGGNGVLMRVAPLAYSAAGNGTSDDDLLMNVMRNGVVTHGHPRALFPACLHALSLTRMLRRQQSAPPGIVHQWIEELCSVPEQMESDPILGRETLRAFDDASPRPFSSVWHETAQELHELIERFFSHDLELDAVSHYLRASRSSGLFKKATLGSGTATFVAAYWVSEAFSGDPLTGLRLVANGVGSDTDTIATVAGAHFGVTHRFDNGEALLDRVYIEAETTRILDADHVGSTPRMRYPDLDHWRAPRTQADYVGVEPSSGRVAIAGLGSGEWVGPPERGSANPGFAWQWFLTDFGQSLPVKRRADLPVLPTSALPYIGTQGTPGRPTVANSDELDELRARIARANDRARHRKPANTDVRKPGRISDTEPFAGNPRFQAAWTHVEQHGFADEAVGRMARRLTLDLSEEAAVAFVARVARVWRESRP